MTPELSVLVIAYRMPRQALNTLYTLSTKYQRDVSPDEYEVIVVENASDSPMDRDAVAALSGDFRHIYRHDPGVSPAPALNVALAESRAPHVGIMIDGARMVTPGLLRNVLDVFRMDPDALTCCPGFHLGENDQQEHLLHGYDEDEEQRLLAGLPWSGDGYRMFDISCYSLANPNGVAHPMMESNTMFVRREHFERIGGADERFELTGGGMLNLDLYRELCELPETTLWLLPGEGSFHQFHGGTTTRSLSDREEVMTRFREQYEAIRGRVFASPILEPNYYGEVPPQAMRFLHWSAKRGIERFSQRTAVGLPVWSDSPSDPLLAPGLAQQVLATESARWQHEDSPDAPQVRGLTGTRPPAAAPAAPGAEEPTTSAPGQPGGPTRKGRIQRWLFTYRRR